MTTPEGGSFRDGSCYYYEGTKRKVAKTVIIEPADPSDIKYDVWVGSTQVTGAEVARSVVITPVMNGLGIFLGEKQVNEYNKGDIFGDGKASYDKDTKTLTLKNPTIRGVHLEFEPAPFLLHNYVKLVEKGLNTEVFSTSTIKLKKTIKYIVLKGNKVYN